MTDAIPTPTLRTLFELSAEDDSNRLPDSWRPLRDKLEEEVKGIKWTASMPDLTAKIAELLDVQVPTLLLSTWKKAGEVKAKLAESKAAPDDVLYVELADHTISTTHRPHITVHLAKKTVKEIEFVVTASFTLKGFVLKIEKGEVQEIRTGSCEAEGTLEALAVVLAKKDLKPLYFPGSIPIHAA